MTPHRSLVRPALAMLAAATLSTAAGTQRPGQVDQFYEQYRSNGSVTGPCDAILAFSQRVQKLFDGTRWFSEQDYTNAAGAQRRFFYTNTGRETIKACSDCCVEKLTSQSLLSFTNRDEFGGIEGNYKTRFSKQTTIRDPDYVDRNKNTLEIICEAAATKPSNGELTLRVPVEQSDAQCTMQMPKLVLLSSGEETVYTAKLVSTSTFQRVDKDGEARTYRKVQPNAPN